MSLSRIADKSRPDYWPRRVIALELELGKLRAARFLSRIDIGGVRIAAGTGEAQVRDTTDAFIPIRASSFPTASSRDVKDDLGPISFDAVEAIKAATARTWRYKPEFAVEDLEHTGPMAEDLPDALVHDADGVLSVDMTSMVGTLWDAVGKLIERGERLEARVDELGARVAELEAATGEQSGPVADG